MISVLAGLLMGTTPGLQVGENVSPFEPYWVTGPYAETRMCPVCEYAMLPMVVVWSQLKAPAKLLPLVQTINQSVAAAPEGRQKAFLVDLNETAGDKKSRENLKKVAEKATTPNVYFMSRVFTTKAVQKDYKLQPYSGWETIVFITKRRLVVSKFVDPKPDDLPLIAKAIEDARQP
jgi:hypothetical protein